MAGWTAFELSVLDALHNLTGWGPVDALMRLISQLGDNGLVFILAALALLLFKKTRRYGAVAAFALLLDAVAVNIVLKPLFGRVRPFDAAGLLPLIAPPGDASFPSGHTAAAFAFAASLWPMGMRWRVFGFALAGLMGLSRLYLYVHFPSDVLAGAVIGCLCGAASLFLWKKSGLYDILDENRSGKSQRGKF